MACVPASNVTVSCGAALANLQYAMGGQGTLVGCCELVFETHVLKYTVTFKEFTRYEIQVLNKLTDDESTVLWGGDMEEAVNTLNPRGPFI